MGVHQSLSYRFVLRSDDPDLAELAVKFIADFAPASDRDPDAGTHPVYTLSAATGSDGRPHYTLARDDRVLAASADRSLILSELLWQISGDTVDLSEGYLLVHAGAVVTPGGEGVLILGESGSGKTTLVAALVQDGFGYLSDEAGAIELATGLLQPWPRPLGFMPSSRQLPRFAEVFEPDSADARPTGESHVSIERIRTGAIGEACRIRYVFDHRYAPGEQPHLEPLSQASGLVQVGSAAPRLRHEGDRGLRLLADIMRDAHAYRLVSGDLEQTIRLIREQVGH
jgi:hypothetical protein